MQKVKAAIIGSGNIGTDLMIKIMRHGDPIEMAMLVGIDPESEGLARARRLNVAITADGIDGLLKSPMFAGIEIIFDATSASAHKKHDELLKPYGKQVIDLTPAALG